MKRIVIDIETSAAPNAADMAPEFTAPANYKDAQKIAESIAAQKTAFLERAALDPLTGQILCYTSAYDNEPPECMIAEEGVMIAQMLSVFLDCIHTGTKIVGFNSKGFDLPFIIRRAFILGIDVHPMLLRLTDRVSEYHFDLLQIWLCGSREWSGQSLARICKACGIGEKSGNGADFAALLKTDPAAAKAYAINDVVLTQKLADRLLL